MQRTSWPLCFPEHSSRPRNLSHNENAFQHFQIISRINATAVKSSHKIKAELILHNALTHQESLCSIPARARGMHSLLHGVGSPRWTVGLTGTLDSVILSRVNCVVVCHGWSRRCPVLQPRNMDYYLPEDEVLGDTCRCSFSVRNVGNI